MKLTFKPTEWFDWQDLPSVSARPPEVEALLEAMDELPAREREVLQLLWFTPYDSYQAGVGELERPGLPVAEVARQLGLTRRMVRVLEARGIGRLKVALGAS